jgi:hypothetical protein
MFILRINAAPSGEGQKIKSKDIKKAPSQVPFLLLTS